MRVQWLQQGIILTLQVVPGLADVHPVAIQGVSIQLVVSSNVGEDLPLNRSGAELDAVQHRWAAHIDASIDLIANKILQAMQSYLSS